MHNTDLEQLVQKQAQRTPISQQQRLWHTRVVDFCCSDNAVEVCNISEAHLKRGSASDRSSLFKERTMNCRVRRLSVDALSDWLWWCHFVTIVLAVTRTRQTRNWLRGLMASAQ